MTGQGGETLQRCFSNILVNDVERSAQFYEALLGMKRHFESDWFIILTHEDQPGLEYGLIQKDHEIVPKAISATAGGMMVTFVVADCDDIYERAKQLDANIVEAPRDMFYGQRRMILLDPDGAVLDISAPTANIP